MKTARLLLITVASIILASCSGSHTATTRKEKETEFKDTFGFSPPSAIVSIEYTESHSRGATDGAFSEWIRFTYDEATYQKILSRGYKLADSGRLPTGGAFPAWWPKSVAGNPAVFTRDQNDTPADEGFSFEEYLWYDASTAQVFFYKSCWD